MYHEIANGHTCQMPLLLSTLNPGHSNVHISLCPEYEQLSVSSKHLL